MWLYYETGVNSPSDGVSGLVFLAASWPRQTVLFGDRVIILEMMDGTVWVGREGKTETQDILKCLEEGEKDGWGKEDDLLWLILQSQVIITVGNTLQFTDLFHHVVGFN